MSAVIAVLALLGALPCGRRLEHRILAGQGQVLARFTEEILLEGSAVRLIEGWSEGPVGRSAITSFLFESHLGNAHARSSVRWRSRAGRASAGRLLPAHRRLAGDQAARRLELRPGRHLQRHLGIRSGRNGLIEAASPALACLTGGSWGPPSSRSCCAPRQVWPCCWRSAGAAIVPPRWRRAWKPGRHTAGLDRSQIQDGALCVRTIGRGRTLCPRTRGSRYDRDVEHLGR